MRHLLFVALVIFGLSPTILSAQTIKLMPGSVLTYDVHANSKHYEFIVTINKIDESIDFDYKMTNPDSLTGSVIIKPKALKTAHKMINYFSGGKLKLKDATTVFLCQECYQDAMGESGKLEIMFDKNPDPTTLDKVEPGRKENIKVNGKMRTLTCATIYTEFYSEEDGQNAWGNQLTVLQDEEFPLIVSMYLDFGIRLVSAENVEYVEE